MCCQNYVCGCGETCKSLTDPCPAFCGCLEAFCFPWCTLGTNRAFLQDKYMIANTKMENMMALMLCFCRFTIAILSAIVPIPRDIRCLLDCIDMACAGCYLSQQQHEWDFREKGEPSLSNQLVMTEDNNNNNNNNNVFPLQVVGVDDYAKFKDEEGGEFEFEEGGEDLFGEGEEYKMEGEKLEENYEL